MELQNLAVLVVVGTIVVGGELRICLAVGTASAIGGAAMRWDVCAKTSASCINITTSIQIDNHRRVLAQTRHFRQQLFIIRRHNRLGVLFFLLCNNISRGAVAPADKPRR